MNPNELTPTHKVAKARDMNYLTNTLGYNFAIELAAELERVSLENDLLRQGPAEAGWASKETIAAYKKERDDLKRQLEATVRGEHCTCSDPVNDGDCASCKIAKYADLKRQVEGLKEAAIRNSDPDLIELLRQLRAENAELQKDKERLDWLAQQRTIPTEYDGALLKVGVGNSRVSRTAISEAMKGQTT